MSETDWELKDRRIAWMNMNTACSVIQAARITSGLFKPKNKDEAMKDLLLSIDIEFQAFLNLSSTVRSASQNGSGGQPTESVIISPPVFLNGSVGSSPASPITKKAVGKHKSCWVCGAPITPAVFEFIESHRDRFVGTDGRIRYECYECQGKPHDEPDDQGVLLV